MRCRVLNCSNGETNQPLPIFHAKVFSTLAAIRPDVITQHHSCIVRQWDAMVVCVNQNDLRFLSHTTTQTTENISAAIAALRPWLEPLPRQDFRFFCLLIADAIFAFKFVLRRRTKQLFQAANKTDGCHQQRRATSILLVCEHGRRQGRVTNILLASVPGLVFVAVELLGNVDGHKGPPPVNNRIIVVNILYAGLIASERMDGWLIIIH